MTSKRLRGLNIKIGGDTTELNKALSDVDKQSKKLKSELTDVNKMLKFDTTNPQLLAQKQQLLTASIETTSERLNKLKQAQAEVEQKFQKGELGADKYRAFQREVMETESALTQLSMQLQSTVNTQENLASSTKQLQRFFEVTGKSIDDFATSLDSRLVDAIREGRATSSQLETALNQMGQAALGADVDLERLRQSLNSLDSGGSIEDVRRELSQLEQEAKQADKTIGNLGDTLAGLAGGAVAGLGIQEVVSQAMESGSLDARINVLFDVDEASKASIRETVREVEKFGVDGTEALEAVRRQFILNKDASNELNNEIVTTASAIASAYEGIDLTELIQENHEIASELEISSEQAIGLVNHLLSIGFPTEQLDIISEYGHQLKRAGYNAREIQALFEAGVNTGTWNIDNLMDGLKEARIKAAEFATGIPASLRDALSSIEGMVTKVDEAQVEAMSKSFASQEKAMSKSFSAQEKALSKAHEHQKKALDKRLANESKALSKSQENQQKALEKALNAEMKAYEQASKQKMKLLDDEYMAKLKVIDEEKYNKLKALDTEIAKLNGLTNAENKAAQQASDNEQRANLQKAVREAKSITDRKNALNDLAKFENDLALRTAQEQRSEKVDALKLEQDAVKDSFDDKKEVLDKEYEVKKEQLTATTDAEKEALQEQHSLRKEALQEQQQLAMEHLQEQQQAQKDALNERLSAQSDAVREAHQAELESFKAMNAEKLKIASTSQESAEFKALEEKFQRLGEIVATGTEEQANKAFEEMIAILDEMEAGGVKEALGTALFRTKWEDEGENLLQTIRTYKDYIKVQEETDKKVKETKKGMEDDPTVQWAESMNSLKEAIKPALDELVKFINAISEFVKENPIITTAIMAIVTALGSVAGIMTMLLPYVLALFGVGGSGGVFGNVVKVITNIGTKILPLLGTALAALTSPIGLTVAAIAAIIAIIVLLVKHCEGFSEFFVNMWTSIKEFFSDLVSSISDGFSNMKNKVTETLENFKTIASEKISQLLTGISQTITNAKENIVSTFRNIWSGVTDTFTTAKTWLSDKTDAIVEGVITKFTNFKTRILDIFDLIKKRLQTTWSNIADVIKTPLNMLIDLLNNFIRGVNQIQVPDWIPAIGGQGISIPEIPHYAVGTNYHKGGLAIVGERGAELVDLPRGSKVRTHEQTKDLLSGSDTINIEVKSLVVREEADVKRVAKELHKLQTQAKRAKGVTT